MAEIPEGWRVIEGGKAGTSDLLPEKVAPDNLTYEAIESLLEYCDDRHTEMDVVGDIDLTYYEQVKLADLYDLYSQLHACAGDDINLVPRRLALMRAISEHSLFQSGVLRENDAFEFITPTENPDTE